MLCAPALSESFEPAACEAICAKAAGCACLEYTPDPETGGGHHRCKIYSGVTALKTFARHDAYVLSGNDGGAAIVLLTGGSGRTGRLIARRLVERGVRFVHVLGGNQSWDHHHGIKGSLPKACKKTDRPIAALVRARR